MGLLDTIRARVKLNATDVAIVVVVVIGVVNALVAFWEWIAGG